MVGWAVTMFIIKLKNNTIKQSASYFKYIYISP